MRAAALRIRYCCLAGVLAVLMPLNSIARQDVMAPEVYSDERLTIHAGVSGLDEKIIHFGDELILDITVTYDANRLELQEPDSQFFGTAWPQSEGAYLMDKRVNLTASPGSGQAEFRFQILSCPGDEPICRGTRQYELPEFSLVFRVLNGDKDGENLETVSFRPWPTTIAVSSAIPLTQEGELFSFSRYFPSGAYPRPLSGEDQSAGTGSLVAGGLVFLLGGIVMSPFGFLRRKSLSGRAATRWERVLGQLQGGEFKEEDHFLDGLRRCLIWYCVDELDVDPFEWLKRSEEVSIDDQEQREELGEYRQLFLDLLHSPRGQGEALLDRLTMLVSNEV